MDQEIANSEQHDPVSKMTPGPVLKTKRWKLSATELDWKWRVNLKSTAMYSYNEASPPSSASFVKTQTIPYLGTCDVINF